MKPTTQYWPKMVAKVLVAGIIYTIVLMYLWNLILVPVLGVKIISIWQSLGILIIAKMLFGGRPNRCNYYGNCGHKSEHFGRKWKYKYEKMTDDEKDKMKDFFGKFKDDTNQS